ncbi:MAG: hypothetical protein U1E15_11030 [Hyphomicrobiales bacterium]
MIDGAGADTMVGGAGDDTYYVDDLNDVVTELAGGSVAGLSSVSWVASANIENVIYTGAGNINITGIALDSTLTGTIGNNIIDGGAGAGYHERSGRRRYLHCRQRG